jgi:hypothetical protein
LLDSMGVNLSRRGQLLVPQNGLSHLDVHVRRQESGERMPQIMPPKTPRKISGYHSRLNRSGS